MKKLLSAILGLSLIAAPFFANATVIPTGRAYSGDLTITSGTTTDNSVESNITVATVAGQASTTVASVTGFAAGQYVMLVQVVDSGSTAGNYEFQQIRSVVGSSLFFYGTLANNYLSTGAEVIKVSEYHNVTISGGTWTATSWNGTKGGFLVAFLTGSLQVTAGTITAPSGFGGGQGFGQNDGQNIGNQGDSASSTGSHSTSANGTSGGGGQREGGSGDNASGGGGSYGSGGGGGQTGCCGVAGSPGNTIGPSTLAKIFFGGAGGGGACAVSGPCTSGSGGGSPGDILIFAASTTISGTGSITSTGSNGGTGTVAGGGAGSGGGIRLANRLNETIGSSLITAVGGTGGADTRTGGNGGNGRIAGLAGATLNGTANPTIDTSSTDTIYDVDNKAIPITLGSSF